MVDDLSNGTSLARASDKVFNECDVGTITSLPVADIIWVIDESGSMSDNRTDIVNNANNFFSRALSSGLDFRMGVTNVCSPTGSYKSSVGNFCSTVSTNTSDLGGADRFLLPSEQTIFSACIKNPPGYEGGSEYGMVNATRGGEEAPAPGGQRPDEDPPQRQAGDHRRHRRGTPRASPAPSATAASTCTLPAATQANAQRRAAATTWPLHRRHRPRGGGDVPRHRRRLQQLLQRRRGPRLQGAGAAAGRADRRRLPEGPGQHAAGDHRQHRRRAPLR